MAWEYDELVRLTREALQDERRAAVFYDRLLRQVYRYDTIQALAQARHDERIHIMLLENILRELTGMEPPPAGEVYPPVYKTVEDGLRIALADEKEATATYDRLARMALTPAMRQTFLRIKEDEILHATLLEALLSPEPPWLKQE